MIRRNKRNIGREVKIKCPHLNNFNEQLGIIKGFGGDWQKGIPYVNVFVLSTESVWPVPGCFLYRTGNKKGRK